MGQSRRKWSSVPACRYPEALTELFKDRSDHLSHHGNYGVPDRDMEDNRIHVSGLIVSNYVDTPSHTQSTMTLSSWLQREKVPALEIKVHVCSTQHIRTHGTMFGQDCLRYRHPFHDPNKDTWCAKSRSLPVSGSEETSDAPSPHRLWANAICAQPTRRNVRVSTVPRGLGTQSPANAGLHAPLRAK